MASIRTLVVTAIIGLSTVPFATQAQDAAAPAAAAEPKDFITLSGTAAFVSDYRFRGISLSDKHIAGQASITATSEPGFFASIWGSSIEPIGATETSTGAHQEIDVTAGFAKEFSGITPTIGVVGYLYPGGTGVDYYEVFGSVAGALGPVNVTVGVNYAPNQSNLESDNTYVYILPSFAIPDTPVTLVGSVGYESGSLQGGPKGKVDYMVGVNYAYKFITLGAQYVGNDLGDQAFDRRISKSGFVFSITAAF